MRKTAAFLLLSILFSLPAGAWAAGDYQAKVAVDVTAASAAKARERAMAEADRRAVLSVAQKITSEEGVAKLESLSADQIDNFVKAMDIVDEKTSPVRYIATLAVTVNGEVLRDYLADKGFPVGGSSGETGEGLMVLYKSASLRDWLETERRIKAAPGVREVELLAMGGGKFQFRLRYSGSPESLAHALSQRALKLREGRGILVLERI